MAIKLGTRDDLERAIRRSLTIPIAPITAFMAVGILKDYTPPLLSAVLGGAVGGGVGYVVAAAIIGLLGVVWPRRRDESKSGVPKWMRPDD